MFFTPVGSAAELSMETKTKRYYALLTVLEVPCKVRFATRGDFERIQRHQVVTFYVAVFFRAPSLS